MRTILHCDCNSFYATIELAANPHLRGKPLVVCGDPNLRHGIVLAKSPEAKACGIFTGEVLWEAKKKCPQLLLIHARHKVYLDYSRGLRSICRQYTPFVEPFGLDESWLDVSHHALSGEEIAARIRQAAKEELGITTSVGVSYNKVFAKLGSEMRKPDATTVITPENFREKVWIRSVDDLLFVGRATKKRLAQMGIHTIGQLAQCDTKLLWQAFGKNGLTIQAFARGKTTPPCCPLRQRTRLNPSATAPRRPMISGARKRQNPSSTCCARASRRACAATRLPAVPCRFRCGIHP